MLHLRPIRALDLDDMFELASEAAFGITTLTKDREVLAAKIEHAEHSFATMPKKPGAETYLFALEDTERRRVVGTAAIEAKVGGFQPFYSFRIEQIVRRSADLGIVRELRLLRLHADHDGPSAIGTLYLMPEYRRDGNGRFLSLARFLFLALHPAAFEDRVIAEMRGVSDREGRCPFWEGVGRHFFGMDFPKADYLSGIDKKFIAELLPDIPICADLLPESARNVLGKTHPATEPALKLLYGEGFSFMHHVDIFDGGPLVAAEARSIRTVRTAQRVHRCEKPAPSAESVTPFEAIVARTDRFCAIHTHVQISHGECFLKDKAAHVLGLEGEPELIVSPLR